MADERLGARNSSSSLTRRRSRRESARRVVAALARRRRAARRGTYRADRRFGRRAAVQGAAHAGQPRRARLDAGASVVGRRAFRAHRPSRSRTPASPTRCCSALPKGGHLGRRWPIRRRCRRRRAGLTIDAENVHPVEVDETLSDDNPVELAAQLYLRELNRYVPLAKGGVPVFDVILAGIGVGRTHLLAVSGLARARARRADRPRRARARAHRAAHRPRDAVGPCAARGPLVIVMSAGRRQGRS